MSAHRSSLRRTLVENTALITNLNHEETTFWVTLILSPESFEILAPNCVCPTAKADVRELTPVKAFKQQNTEEILSLYNNALTASKSLVQRKQSEIIDALSFWGSLNARTHTPQTHARIHHTHARTHTHTQMHTLCTNGHSNSYPAFSMSCFTAYI